MLCFDYTLCIVIVCMLFLGCTAGLIGAFAFLREQSLLGDALAHACLPGTAIAFILASGADRFWLMFGAWCSGLCALVSINLLRRTTVFKMDTILGIILSVFFGFGLVCITMAQQYALPQQSLLTTIIFGNAATICMYDCYIVLITTCMLALHVALWWKELKLTTFDHVYARTQGYSVGCYDAFITLLLMATIIIGLRIVGVILMSTLLIAPAAASRLWTSRFSTFIGCSALFGACASVIGIMISAAFHHMPTGPVIAVVAIMWTLFSLVLTKGNKYTVS